MHIQQSIIDSINDAEQKVLYAAYAVDENDNICLIKRSCETLSKLFDIARLYLYVMRSDKAVIILTNAISLPYFSDLHRLNAYSIFDDYHCIKREDISW